MATEIINMPPRPEWPNEGSKHLHSGSRSVPNSCSRPRKRRRRLPRQRPQANAAVKKSVCQNHFAAPTFNAIAIKCPRICCCLLYGRTWSAAVCLRSVATSKYFVIKSATLSSVRTLCNVRSFILTRSCTHRNWMCKCFTLPSPSLDAIPFLRCCLSSDALAPLCLSL